MVFSLFAVLWWLASLSSASAHVIGYGEQPLSKIAIHKTTSALRESVSIQANPVVLGLQVQKFHNLHKLLLKICKACAFHKDVEFIIHDVILVESRLVTDSQSSFDVGFSSYDYRARTLNG
jgi:hypothetical protein